MALPRRKPLPIAPTSASPSLARGRTRPPALWLALQLTDFALRVFAASDLPFAVTAGSGARRTIVAADAASARLGVCAGQGIAAALAFAPTLVTAPRAAVREQAALARLAAWAQRFTPTVSLEPPAALLLEVRGSLRLFGGMAALAARVASDLAELGHAGRIALAPTPRAALWFARAAIPALIDDPAELPGALGCLPLDALGLDPGTVARLAGVGVRSVRDLGRLPRTDAARRYGRALLADLDRALGRLPEPRAAFMAPARFRGVLDLPCECASAQRLAHAAGRLVAELCGGLVARGAGVRRLALELRHRASPHTVLRLGLLAPTRDAAHLDRLLAERLARTPLRAAVRALALVALEVEPLDAEPLDAEPHALFATTARGSRAALVETLRARLGADAVRGLACRADHRPELAWCWCDPAPAASGGTAPSAACGSRQARPAWLLAVPQPLAALRGRPRLAGAALVLEAGPERIESGWWDGADAARDYYVARARDGARLWVFRTRRAPQAWFLHGIFA